jgi:DNA-binding response OmpR family regulator
MEPANHQSNTRSVLIVDDDVNICKMIAMTLAVDNIPSVSVGKVDEACSLLKQGSFSLVLLDWELDRSGEEVLRYARQLDPLLPVIVMSSLPSDVKTDALLGEADSFIEKPPSPALIRAHIKWWFKRLDATPIRLLPQNESEIRPPDEIRNAYIRHVVKLLGGNASLAAEKMGIHRQTVSAIIKDEEPK